MKLNTERMILLAWMLEDMKSILRASVSNVAYEFSKLISDGKKRVALPNLIARFIQIFSILKITVD